MKTWRIHGKVYSKTHIVYGDRWEYQQTDIFVDVDSENEPSLLICNHHLKKSFDQANSLVLGNVYDIRVESLEFIEEYDPGERWKVELEKKKKAEEEKKKYEEWYNLPENIKKREVEKNLKIKKELTYLIFCIIFIILLVIGIIIFLFKNNNETTFRIFLILSIGVGGIISLSYKYHENIKEINKS
jgi:hypothetical protein